MPKTLKINYPFKPFIFTQKWGEPNPAYDHFGFTRHNGVDAYTGGGPIQGTTWPVWCPVDGFVVDKVQYRPEGGGNEIWMVSKEPLLMGDEVCYAYLVMCHAEKIFLKAGDEPVGGDLVMIADHTGFSTGPHTHIGLYRVHKNGASWIFFDQNDANGSHNPEPYFTGEFAVDVASYLSLFKGGLRYYTYLSTGL